jgi:hypothetical protein
MSIPISALVSPHAPSISRSSKFHMQDPRKPPRKRDTGWSLRFRGEEEVGSPVQAWFFFVGFVLFPLWWAASIMRTPETRQVGGSDTEKAVTLDDPQVEHGTFLSCYFISKFIDVELLFLDRCKSLALSLSNHDRYFFLYLCSIHRPHCRLRTTITIYIPQHHLTDDALLGLCFPSARHSFRAIFLSLLINISCISCLPFLSWV